MAEQLSQRKQPLLLRAIARTLFHITLPPVAGRYHGRYRGRPHHLAFDTFLAAGILVLLVWNILLSAGKNESVSAGVRLSIEMPGTVQSGDEINVTFLLENTGTTASDLELRLSAPERWDSIEPTVSSGIVWKQSSLAADASTTVPLSAIITGRSDQPYLLHATITYAVDGTRMTDTAIAQYSVDTSGLKTELALPDTVVAGQTFDAALTVQNTTRRDMADVTAVLSLPDGVTLLAAEPALDQIVGPSAVLAAEQTVSAQLTLLASAALENKPVALTATTSLRGIAQTSDTKNVLVRQPTESDVRLRAEPVYWSDAGIQFGFGPLPPKVGERTGYRLIWIVEAGTLPVHESTVKATLPFGAEWNGNATVGSGEPLRYDGASRTVSWTLGAVAPKTAVSASFDVTVKPLDTDVGNTLMLLNPSKLEGTLSDGRQFFTKVSEVRNALINTGSPDSGRVTK